MISFILGITIVCLVMAVSDYIWSKYGVIHESFNSIYYKGLIDGILGITIMIIIKAIMK